MPSTIARSPIVDHASLPNGKRPSRSRKRADKRPPVGVARHGWPTRRAAGRRIGQLRGELRQHDYLYYVLDKPKISDEQYDRLYDELRTLEAHFPDLVTPDSPTQRVGGEPLSQFRIVAHSVPLLSLESTRDLGAVRRFVTRALKSDAPHGLLLQPKLDGVSIELLYERGELIHAITRGNGREGEDVTTNARTIPSIPLALSAKERPVPPRLAVRGEIMMDRVAFRALNEELLKSGEEPLANPRNAAAGALRQLDPRITARRHLRFIAHEMLGATGAAFLRDRDVLAALRAWSLPTPKYVQTATTLDEVNAYHRAMETRRDTLPYAIDGIVIKHDALDRRSALGATAHHPRWALAWKFAPRAEVTRVERIVVQVGRTGVLTPVALLQPVEVSGVTVSRATLHNRAELAARDIRAGDLVRVHRAGDVIPEIAERIPEARRRRQAKFRMPPRCPACRTRTIERGPLTICPNAVSCRAQLIRALMHLASEDGFDIAGVGARTAARLVHGGLVRAPADLFGITPREIETLGGFAERSAATLTGAIAASRRIPLHRFLFAIGLPGVGPATARAIARAFQTLEGVRHASRDALAAVPGLGAHEADSIHQALRDPRRRALIAALLRHGVKVAREPAAPRGPLANRHFAFTGVLSHVTRREAGQLVQSLGAAADPDVTAATNYVVAGSHPGEKLSQARDRGLKILTERQFFDLLTSARGW